MHRPVQPTIGVNHRSRRLEQDLIPLVDDVIFPLTSGYGLTVKALSTARTLIQADLSMMESGVVPPHTICEDVLVFLRTRYPQAILVKSFQA